MRLMVYSHDTFGLGNIRRMLAICSHLHASIPDLSILIVSGSPMLQSFRVAQGIDYIKLPCLKRTESGELGVRFLDLEVAEIVRLRRELILSTAVSFRPDIVLVDKKPDGLAGELEPSLRYIRCNLPQARILLVLRDILDSSRATVDAWEEHGYYSTLQWYYDAVLVLGDRQIYDVCKEYEFPESLRQKIHLCSACQARRRTEDSCRADGEFRRVQNHSSRCTHAGCPGKCNRRAVTGCEKPCPGVHLH